MQTKVEQAEPACAVGPQGVSGREMAGGRQENKAHQTRDAQTERGVTRKGTQDYIE